MRRVFLVLLLVVCGCETKQVVKEVVPLEDLAPSILETAKQTLPQVKFESARKIKLNGEDVFEIRGKMPNGKIREVEVSAAGKVVEVE